MFDTPPSNLPVEPSAPASAPPGSPPIPKPPSESPMAQGINVSGSKEPEDIFSDIEESKMSASQKADIQSMQSFSRPSSSPWKLVLGIGIPIIVVGLGVGGYLVYQSLTSASPLVIQDQVMEEPGIAVPLTSEPVSEAPVQNPVAPPDEQQLAASQAASALLQAQAEQGLIEASMATDTMMEGEVVMDDGSMTEEGAIAEAPANVAPQQAVAPPTGPDSDEDGLTNSEEVLLGTDPNISDSDADGYADLSELQNGYDPAVPQNPLDQSTFLKKVTIGSMDFMVPTAWDRQAGIGGTVKILTGTPASFTISMEPFASDETLINWLVAKYPGTGLSDYTIGNNINGLDMVYSKDKMAAWLVGANTAYAIRYSTNGSGTKDFGMLFDLMLIRAIMSK